MTWYELMRCECAFAKTRQHSTGGHVSSLFLKHVYPIHLNSSCASTPLAPSTDQRKMYVQSLLLFRRHCCINPWVIACGPLAASFLEQFNGCTRKGRQKEWCFQITVPERETFRHRDTDTDTSDLGHRSQTLNSTIRRNYEVEIGPTQMWELLALSLK